MASLRASVRSVLPYLVTYAVLVLLSLSRVLEAAATPWRWMAGGLAVGFLVFGPVSWLTSARLSQRVSVTITTVALLGAVLLVGLTNGFLGVELHALALGIYAGLVVAILSEAVAVPAENRVLLTPR